MTASHSVQPFAVGVTGHRPNRLAEARRGALTDEAERLFRHLTAVLPASPDLVSSLAEGADRLVAQAALAGGCGLVCPLPFPAGDYSADFSGPGSVEDFHALLARARLVVELPGRRDDEPAAYTAAGRWMLERIDLLVCVWDGGASAGPGGTRDIVDQALERGLSVLWLHATEDRAPRLLRPPEGKGAACPAALETALLAMTDVPILHSQCRHEARMSVKRLPNLDNRAVATATEGARRRFLNNLPLLAGAPADAMARLVERSTLIAAEGKRWLFLQNGPAKRVFFVQKGAVLIRRHSSNEEDDIEQEIVPPEVEDGLLLEVVGAGGLVAGDELFDLLAGSSGEGRRHATFAHSAHTVAVVPVLLPDFAEFLDRAPMVRRRLAAIAADRSQALRQSLQDQSALKFDGKAVLAKALLTLFSLFPGKPPRLPRRFSQTELAAALGLSRRQVAEDLPTLKLLDVVDEDSAGCLVLLEDGRSRMERLVRRDRRPADDRDAWVDDIRNAIGSDELPRARAMARIALGYFKDSEELYYQAALACLRAGSLPDAEKLLTRQPFSIADDDEDKAAIFARIDKERAFQATSVADRPRLALRSAQAYRSIHARTNGTYTGINAAAMLRVAGDDGASRDMARSVLNALSGRGPGDYWGWATRAEAHGLLGQFDDAKADLRRARTAEGATNGAIGSTRLQFRRLAGVTGDKGWQEMLHLIGLPDLIVIPARPADASPIPGLVDFGDVMPGTAWLGGLGSAADIETAERLTGLGCAVNAVVTEPWEIHRSRVGASLGKDWGLRLAGLAARISVRAMLDQPPPDGAAADREGQANRLALGLGLSEAAAEERFCFLQDGGGVLRVGVPGAPVDCRLLPGWAQPDTLAAGFHALVMMDTGFSEITSEADGVLSITAAGDRLAIRFASIGTALDMAIKASEQAVGSGGDRLTVCDIVPADGAVPPDDAAALLRSVARNQIYASPAFAAELALLPRSGLRVRQVGRIGRQRIPCPFWTVIVDQAQGA